MTNYVKSGSMIPCIHNRGGLCDECDVVLLDEIHHGRALDLTNYVKPRNSTEKETELRLICKRLSEQPFLRHWEDIITVLRATPVMLDEVQRYRKALTEIAALDIGTRLPTDQENAHGNWCDGPCVDIAAEALVTP